MRFAKICHMQFAARLEDAEGFFEHALLILLRQVMQQQTGEYAIEAFARIGQTSRATLSQNDDLPRLLGLFSCDIQYLKIHIKSVHCSFRLGLFDQQSKRTRTAADI